MDKLDRLLIDRKVWIEREFYERGKDVVELTVYGHQYVSNYRFAMPTSEKYTITKEEYEERKEAINSDLYQAIYGETDGSTSREDKSS